MYAYMEVYTRIHRKYSSRSAHRYSKCVESDGRSLLSYINFIFHLNPYTDGAAFSRVHLSFLVFALADVAHNVVLIRAY